MNNSSQLANRFREVILNGRWIANTNMKDQLSDVTLEQSLKKVANLNTLAALTFHINYYVAGVLQVFEGGSLDIRDQFSFDVPNLELEKQWEDLKNKLFSNAERFAIHVEKMTDEKLNEVFVKEKYGDYKRNIEAMIEHAYYHLGQMTLIKKIIVASD
ncbi:MAG: DUF1572 domain-containing protein [Bacteroidota bacterium]